MEIWVEDGDRIIKFPALQQVFDLSAQRTVEESPELGTTATRYSAIDGDAQDFRELKDEYDGVCLQLDDALLEQKKTLEKLKKYRDRYILAQKVMRRHKTCEFFYKIAREKLIEKELRAKRKKARRIAKSG